ncbi:MAG TPA: hypothetical protein VLJ41_13370 [Segetibacter sp.]|nr:hypothetical protein [Segetibacter sp.]
MMKSHYETLCLSRKLLDAPYGKKSNPIKVIMKLKPLLTLSFLLVTATVFAQKLDAIRPGEVWPDEDGNHIQAHGGGIIKMGKTYYWYGEERAKGLDTNFRYVSCYSSNDLMNWKFRGDVVKMSDPENLGRRWVLERPKVF